MTEKWDKWQQHGHDEHINGYNCIAKNENDIQNNNFGDKPLSMNANISQGR